jgi:putative ABC transport system substrate-binding protein
MEVLKELVPTMKRLAVLWTPSNPLHAKVLKDLEPAARSLAVQLHALKVTTPEDFEGTFQSARADRAGAAWVLGDTMFFAHRDRLAAAALNARLPTMFTNRQNVNAGGLASYGPAVPVMYRRAASYVDHILRGVRSTDLPIEQPTKLELVINLTTAKALGLTIPPSLLARADQVIE